MIAMMGHEGLFENTVEVGRTELKEGEDQHQFDLQCERNILNYNNW
jgi:hypothetical protein